MTSSVINQGDLLAHLDGERLPHLDAALRNQPELRTQLKTLREADQFLQKKFGRILRPDSQDLVDVVTGQASTAQELRVMAFVRQSPAGHAEMAALIEAFAEAQAAEEGASVLQIIHDILHRLFGTQQTDRGFRAVLSLLSVEVRAFMQNYQEPILQPIRTALRQFIALPLQATGVRGTRALYSQETENTFYVAELDARVTVYPSPAFGEEWIIEGYLTQKEEPMDDISATLEQNNEIIASTATEDGGFFTFESIEAGTYQIKIHLQHGTLIIPQIELEDE